MRRTCIFTVVIGAMALAGCAHSLELPSNFVELEKQDRGRYAFRAVSPQGAVIALQVQDNPKNGTLEFWHAAIENELTTSDGECVPISRLPSGPSTTIGISP